MSILSETFRIGAFEGGLLSDGAASRVLGGDFHGVEPVEWRQA